MSNSWKILGYNLLIVLIYMSIIGIGNNRSSEFNPYGSLDGMLVAMFCIAIQFVINLIVSIYYFSIKKPVLGGSFLTSAFIVVLIGFSTCMML